MGVRASGTRFACAKGMGLEHVPVVRCHLDGPAANITRRYVPLGEFGLWQTLMEGRHQRMVTVEEVSVWIAEEAAWWSSGVTDEDLEPVVRLRFEVPGPAGAPVLVERFFPAENYALALRSLLAHYAGGSVRPRRIRSTPGYFVRSDVRQPVLTSVGATQRR
jgi:hypothetical protein